LPPLEERREDIPLLVRHFLSSFNERNARQVTVNGDAISLLTRMAWPGNVRELENLIERAAILSNTDKITAEDVERACSAGALSSTKVAEAVTTLKGAERQQIVRALREAQGNRSLAARNLGIERKTLYKKARRLGIDLDAPDQ
jgi:DNA-binding NtrC family response regulator